LAIHPIWEEERLMVADTQTKRLSALRLTKRNLESLIAAKHSDEVLMTPWLEVVNTALGERPFTMMEAGDCRQEQAEQSGPRPDDLVTQGGASSENTKRPAQYSAHDPDNE
jgi:hypothetical protein